MSGPERQPVTVAMTIAQARALARVAGELGRPVRVEARDNAGYARPQPGGGQFIWVSPLQRVASGEVAAAFDDPAGRPAVISPDGVVTTPDGTPWESPDEVETDRDVTPEWMRVLADRALALGAAIDIARQDFQATPAPDESPAARPVDTHTTGDLVRRAGFRLPEAAGQARQIADQMRDTAQDLARIAAVPAGACRIAWPVCPSHGNTITSTGGRSWCRALGCGRSWDYDRGATPCPEPVRWRVTDSHGDEGLMCDGHALDARTHLEGAVVIPLDDPGRRGGRS